jgi:hypothetical protein
MRNLSVPINDSEFKKFGFTGDTISFEELKEKISIEYAKEALLRCNEIAKETGLDSLSLEDINAEINAVRNAKGSA